MIKASFVMDKEHTDALYSYLSKRENVRSARRTILTLCIALLLIFVVCIERFFTGDKFSSAGAIISGIFLYFFAKELIKSFIKPKTPKDRIRCEIIFGDDSFGLINSRESGNFERYKRYESLHSASEWKDWFFVYLTENEVSMMKKSELTEGTPEELREFLKNKLGTRFTVDNE